ncbi:MAG: DUF3352 domain-containing protein [Candidatus Aminicenantes bacterium]|nr:DUF3352 domain-containing protein [Candidatus Aminicenantes bacterium]
MKKAITLSLAVLLTAAFAACTSTSGVKSGAAAGEALIKMMPKSTAGVVAVDVKRLMETEAAKKALQEPQAKAKYDELVKMSGIDPMKDISYLALGLVGSPVGTPGGMNGGAVVNLKYDQAKLQALIKEMAPGAKQETYNGVTIYTGLDGTEAKQQTGAAFLDATHIVIGSEQAVKGIIDVRQKKTESMAKNAEMTALLKKVDKSGLVWGAFAVPQDLLKKGIESQPQLKVLEGVTGLTMSVDYRLATVVADIRTVGGTKEQNATLASTLNGFKSLGAMFAAQEPVVGEALNGIEISSGQDYTRLAINLSQEIIDKLGKFAQSKAGDLINIKKDAPAEEKK